MESLKETRRQCLLDVYTVSFFGHRQIDRFFETEEKVAALVRKLITEKEYVEFLIGRDGEFDQIVASTVRRAKHNIRDDNCELIWVLAYPKAEYVNNADSFDEYYDSVEICDEAARSHPKAAIQIRNRSMVDRSDLVVCYVEHETGGAFQTKTYAEKSGKDVINLAARPSQILCKPPMWCRIEAPHWRFYISPFSINMTNRVDRQGLS